MKPEISGFFCGAEDDETDCSPGQAHGVFAAVL